MYYSLQYQNPAIDKTSRPNLFDRDWVILMPVTMLLIFILFQPLFFSNHQLLDLSEISANDKFDVQQSSNIFRQLIMAFGMIISGIGLLHRIKLNSYRRSNLLLIAPFVIICFASVFWSPVPVITLKRSIQILGLLAIGLFAVQSENPAADILKIIRIIIAASIIVNLMTILFFPKIGITPGFNSWRGFLQHKNSLGAVTVLSVAVWLPAIMENKSWHFRLSAIFITSLTLLLSFNSNSKTSIAINLVLIALWLFIITPLPGTIKSLIIGSLATSTALWFINFKFVSFNHLAQMAFERSADLSGRTQLWALVFDAFHQHPWLGIGYNAFWTSRIIDSSWITFQAHNAYLDILNEVGIIGAACFLIAFVAVIIKSFSAIQSQPDKYLPLFMLLIAIALHNFMESNLCRAMTRGWFLFLLIYVIFFSLPAKRDRAVQD